MNKPRSAAVQRLMDEYAAALPEKLAEIRQHHAATAARADDAEALDAYRSAVHKLAGSAGLYGWPELSRQARALDHHLADILAGDETWSEPQAVAMLQAIEAELPAAGD